jgi:hypothetical protein
MPIPPVPAAAFSILFGGPARGALTRLYLAKPDGVAEVFAHVGDRHRQEHIRVLPIKMRQAISV